MAVTRFRNDFNYSVFVIDVAKWPHRGFIIFIFLRLFKFLDFAFLSLYPIGDDGKNQKKNQSENNKNNLLEQKLPMLCPFGLRIGRVAELAVKLKEIERQLYKLKDIKDTLPSSPIGHNGEEKGFKPMLAPFGDTLKRKSVWYCIQATKSIN